MNSEDTLGSDWIKISKENSKMEPSLSRSEFRRITMNSQTTSSQDPLRNAVRVSAFPGVEVQVDDS